MRRRSVIRDTIQMTVIQFFLECLALLFNAWMTRRVGAATVGTLALAGSFFNLAAMVAGGNAMLCASRFVWESPAAVRRRSCGMRCGFVCCSRCRCRLAFSLLPSR